MNTKNHYIKELEKKLRKIPQDEKTEAVGFYKEYLVDIGVNTYEEAVEKIGTPNKVAAKIMSEYYLKGAEQQTMQPERKRWKVVFAVIAAIFAIPIGLPLALLALALLFMVLLVIVLFIAMFFLLTFIFLISSAILIILSIPTVVIHFYTSLTLIGAALAFFGLGVFTLQLSVFTTKKTYQGLLRLVKNLQKRGKQHA